MNRKAIPLRLDLDIYDEVETLRLATSPVPTMAALLRYLIRLGLTAQASPRPVPRLMQSGVPQTAEAIANAPKPRPIAIRTTPAPDPEPQRGSYSFLAAASEEHQATLREIEPLRESDPVRHNRERILADKRLAAAMNGTEYELQPEDIGLDAEGAKP